MPLDRVPALREKPCSVPTHFHPFAPVLHPVQYRSFHYARTARRNASALVSLMSLRRPSIAYVVKRTICQC